MISAIKPDCYCFRIIENTVESHLSRLLLVPQDQNQKKSRRRLPHLSRDHRQISGNCLVWRIALKGIISSRGSDTVVSLMHNLRKAHGIPPILYRHTNIIAWSQSYADGCIM